MPVIKIREDTEQVVYPASGQSNAAIIPLFVIPFELKPGEETDTGTEKEYSRVELKTQKFSEVEKFINQYDKFAIRDEEGVFVDKNYYMIKDLLSRGLEVYVKPVDLSSETLFPMSDTTEGKVVNTLLTNIFNWGDRPEQAQIESGDETITVYPRESYRTGYDINNTVASNPVITLIPVFKSKDEINYSDFAKILRALIVSNNFYDEFKDKTRFNFKFMTTGSYENVLTTFDANGEPNGEFDVNELSILVNLCAALKDVDKYSGRGDAMVMVDFASDITKSDDNIYKAINYVGNNLILGEKWKFAFCTYPWVIKKSNQVIGGQASKLIPIELTGSYAYLKAFADFINENESNNSLDYMAIAGYNRGTVGDVDDCTPIEDIGEIDMHLFQNDSFSQAEALLPLTINPIIKCSDNMYRIWGNRVMLPLPTDEEGNQVYSDQVKDCNYFLNVRHLVCDIKKECYFASARVSFEPNDDVTWFNFRSIVNPLLDSMVNNRGMEWYSWKRLPADSKGLMKAQLTIKPIEAVESFDITVFIRNTDEQ